jgi:hypothetical protein
MKCARLVFTTECGRQSSLGVTKESHADRDGVHFRYLRLFTAARKMMLSIKATGGAEFAIWASGKVFCERRTLIS